MRYRRNWDGMEEITVEGNTARVARVAETKQNARRADVSLHVIPFTPRATEDIRERQRAAKRYQRQKEVELIRLVLQAVLLMAIFVMICFIDTAGLFGTTVLMAGIIGCSALMILLERKNEH